MNLTEQQYKKMCEKAAPRSNAAADILKAFVIGGAICTLGNAFLELYSYLGFDKTAAGGWTSVTLVFISAVLTGLGLYGKLAKHGGAGTLVPITGFANAVVSPAVEFRAEGFILGLGAKIFIIAGPVILYGTAASVVYGLIYYFFIK